LRISGNDNRNDRRQPSCADSRPVDIPAPRTGCRFPYAALTGDLLLQTLAYTIIAGKSVADGIVFSGISLL
jgi:hypothetical protein